MPPQNSDPTLQLYNTATRSKHPLIVSDRKVKIYACGPTVYNYIHIGNFKTFIVEDILQRSLRFLGHDVFHVMNITDVGHLTDDGDYGEDKMLKSAKQQGKSVWEIADYFISIFLEDSKKLHIQSPDVVCRATDHISEMIEMISNLEKKGYAYVAGGNVYFDVSKFPDYGKMAGLQKVNNRARVESDSRKRDPRDFVLWFVDSKYDNHAMNWDSPWGLGYPGWHIECSAMSRRYLGDEIDIHCGGTDHIPVHHTNEIAQSEALSGKSPWVRFWFHSGFLLTNQLKMSRSTGSFLTLSKLIEEGYHPLDFRYLVLGANYRSQINFSEESLNSARLARLRIVELLASTVEKCKNKPPREKFSDRGLQILQKFAEAIADDLNTSKALASLWELIKIHTIEADEKLGIIQKMDTVFGLNLGKPNENGHSMSRAEIQELIKKRDLARKNRNYSEADSIRDFLAKQGITLLDSTKGTEWKISQTSGKPGNRTDK